MPPRITRMSTAAGISIRTLPRSRRESATVRLAGDVVAERIDDLGVRRRDREPIAEPSDERQREGGHRIGDAERDPVATNERTVTGPLDRHTTWIPAVFGDRLAGGGGAGVGGALAV